MAKKSKKNNVKKTTDKKSRILYWLAAIVIGLPLLLLAFIYFTTKEQVGTPTTGNRFKDSLDPAITEKHITEIKENLKFDGVEDVEINLQSATLHITIDLDDKSGDEQVTSVLNKTYDQVNKVLPIETYFTNHEHKKMYDLDIHVYNYIPEDDNTDGWVYKEKIKNAASKNAIVDTLSEPRNSEVCNSLLEEQKEAEKVENKQ